MVLYAVNQGVFDEVEEDDIAKAEFKVRQAVQEVPEVAEKVEKAEKLSDENLKTMRSIAENVVRQLNRGKAGE
jgi:F0F1-type ATP synthase alpha subunit